MTKNDEAKSRLPLGYVTQREQIEAETTKPLAQERFSEDELANIRLDFSIRFKKAFPGIRQRDIARQLLSTEATIDPYLKNKRFPATEMLLMISRVTDLSIHWLLTGEGEKYPNKTKSLFSTEELDEIEKMAQASGRTFDEELRRLVMVGKAAVKSYRD